MIYRHQDGHILTTKEINKLDYDKTPGKAVCPSRLYDRDMPSDLTEDKIRDTVREVFNVPPAPIVYYTSSKEVMSDWEQELRDKLNKEVPDGAYELPNGLFTGKGGYIEFTIALHKELRKLSNNDCSTYSAKN